MVREEIRNLTSQKKNKRERKAIEDSMNDRDSSPKIMESKVKKESSAQTSLKNSTDNTYASTQISSMIHVIEKN